jgi:ribonuclease E
MAKKIIIDATYPGNTRVALINDKNIIESIEYETENKQQIKGNIYLAKIVRIEPSLQAAFIEYGSTKNGFLPFSEIHPDYYNIPSEDKKNTDSKVTFNAITPPKITSEDMEEQEGGRAIVTDEELAVDPDSLKVKEEVDLDSPDGEGSEAEDAAKATQYKIQDVIKKGQVILVQAQKDERGNKGASFSSFISLAGKYCVLMPNMAKHNGISRRISSLEERRRLRDIITSLTSEDSGSSSVIVRTDGIGKTTYEIKRDYDYLARLWNRVREATIKANAPAFIHMEEGIIIKTIRDMFDNSVSEILLQGSVAYKSALDFIQNILPSDAAKLKEYKAKTPIFTKFGIEGQLANLYQPISHLPSGGYIVINPTEALISIDVNSGKATGERNIEETAFKTNLEAAVEIARQLRLRDLSGLIVIDFIDMYESKNRRAVERELRQSFSRDRARIQTGNLSPFGLLEMSRQRIKSSFLESNSKICHHCNGKGLVRADQSNAMLILRTIENEIFKNHVDVVNVYANLDAVLYIINTKRREISSIEERYKTKLNFYQDTSATADSFSIEKIKTAVVEPDLKEYAMLAQESSFSAEEDAPDHAAEHVLQDNQSTDEPREAKRSKKRRPNNRKRGPRREEGATADGAVVESGEEKAPAAAQPAHDEDASPKIPKPAEDVDGNVEPAPRAYKPRPRRTRKKIGAPSAPVVEG